MWTASHGQILTLDNLMLRGLPLVNRCCMCCCNEEYVNHLLLHCPVAHSLWVQMLQVFRTQWVMPGSVESLVFCWSNWLGKFSSDIWNMVPGYLMWVVWMERNRRSFEAKEKSLVQLQVAKVLFLNGLGAGVLQTILLLWSFLLPLVLPLKLLFLSLLFLLLFLVFTIMNTLYLLFSFFTSRLIWFLLLIKKKKNYCHTHILYTQLGQGWEDKFIKC